MAYGLVVEHRLLRSRLFVFQHVGYLQPDVFQFVAVGRDDRLRHARGLSDAQGIAAFDRQHAGQRDGGRDEEDRGDVGQCGEIGRRVDPDARLATRRCGNTFRRLPSSCRVWIGDAEFACRESYGVVFGSVRSVRGRGHRTGRLRPGLPVRSFYRGQK